MIGGFFDNIRFRNEDIFDMGMNITITQFKHPMLNDGQLLVRIRLYVP